LSKKEKMSLAFDRVAFTRDSKRVFAFCLDESRRIRAWDPTSGIEASVPALKRMPGVYQGAFGGDASRLVVKSEGEINGDPPRLLLLNPESGDQVGTVPITTFPYTGLKAVSPDGQQIACNVGVFVGNWKVSVAMPGADQPIRNIAYPPRAYSSFSFSPDGKRLASASHATFSQPSLLGVKVDPVMTASPEIVIWELASTATALQGHQAPVQCLALNSENEVAASAGDDKVVKIWNLRNSQEEHTLIGHNHAIVALGFAPSGEWIASGQADGPIKIWDVNTGTVLSTFLGQALPKHMVGGKYSLRTLAVSPTGKFIASSGGGQFFASEDKVMLWEPMTGTIVRTWPERAEQVVFSPDGKRLAFAGYYHDKDARPDDHTTDAQIMVVDVNSGKELLRLRTDDQEPQHTLEGPVHSWVNRIAFSPDGTQIVGASNRGWVHVWDLDSRKVLHVFRAHQGGAATEDVILALAFSPDGKRIVTGGKESDVRLWDQATGQEVLRLRGHGDAVSSLAFTKDGQKLVSTGQDGMVRVWDATTAP
jgi:WD40 repeat protein